MPKPLVTRDELLRLQATRHADTEQEVLILQLSQDLKDAYDDLSALLAVGLGGAVEQYIRERYDMPKEAP